MRPPRSVTFSVHASGQSSGQAVSTVDSGGATAGFAISSSLKAEGKRQKAEYIDVPQRSHVVIIGGGFAGLDAARRLAPVDCEVTLVDRHNHHVFSPLLYQV